jgi:hypothetical protein
MEGILKEVLYLIVDRKQRKRKGLGTSYYPQRSPEIYFLQLGSAS